MLPTGLIINYLNKVHQRRSQTIFEQKDLSQVAYTPQKSSLSQSQKNTIANKIHEETRIHWPKALGVFSISVFISYLLLSILSSIFLGYWSFF